jgi:CheY-like chemotaxis protein
MEVLTMAARCAKDCLPSEIQSTDTYNRLQMHRAIEARGDPAAESPFEAAVELLRVLIVDDHRAAADTTAMLVEAWGHDVRCAYDGTTGLSLAAAYQPNVLLLDVLMPHMSGQELARQVRQQPRLDDCFLVAVTGRTDAAHRLLCAEAGIQLFLIKPVEPSILKTLLVWEFEYASRSRRDIAIDRTLATLLDKPTLANSYSRKRSAGRVLQETVAT